MEPADELIELERRGWEALAAGAQEATRFYGDVLDREVAMLFPGGMALTDREQILQSMGGAPWASFALEDPRVLWLTPDCGAVVYGVVAVREGVTYSALVSSIYARRDGDWKLAFHQQTPR